MNHIQLFRIIAFCVSLQGYADNSIVTTNGTTRSVEDLIGVNCADSIAKIDRPWNIAARCSSLTNLNVTTLRYLGGEISMYADLDNEKVFKGGPVIGGDVAVDTDVIGESWIDDITQNYNTNLHPLADYKNAADAAGLDAVFCLNMITPGSDYYGTNAAPLSDVWWSQMDDRLARNIGYLQAADTAGMNVKYIELGNEFYFYGGYREQVFPTTGWSYKNAANDWANQIKSYFSTCQVAIVGSLCASSDRERNWNERIVSNANWSVIDAVTLHAYIDGPYASVAELQGEIDTNGADAAMGKYLATIRDNLSEKISAAKVDTYILNPGRSIWYTEWNVDNLRDGIGDTWANTLATCYLASLLLDTGADRLMIQAFNELVRDTDDANLTAIGKIYSLWAQAARGATGITKLDFSFNPVLKNSTVNSYAGYLFTGNGDRYILFNVNDTSVALDSRTSEFNVKGKQMIRYGYPDDLTTTNDAPQCTVATIGNTLWLNKHSVVLIK